MFISFSAVDTESSGARIAEQLQPGDIVALVGELGAGKTHFVKGIALGLNCSATVTSPTFTVIHEYRGGRVPIFHFDFYRLENVAAVRDIGFDEYISDDGVTIVEWADKFATEIPSRALWVRFSIGPGDVRQISLPSQ